MGYMSQEMKKQLAPGIKAVLDKYGCKGSISVRNGTQLCVSIREGAIDFIGEAQQAAREYAERTGQRYYEFDSYYQANPYRPYDDTDRFVSRKMLNELQQAMRGDLYYNNDDVMTDYFDSAYFMSIDVGRWDKPYKYQA